ncbi:MAG: hypothetical protein GY820_42025 [Gammaproteobacteria bacterium]|nr:hypothetical protein [Gammaproteobacteria bacterium]
MYRKTSQTDQNGNITVFNYDVLDRLIGVIDALSNVTSYDYDEVGKIN